MGYRAPARVVVVDRIRGAERAGSAPPSRRRRAHLARVHAQGGSFLDPGVWLRERTRIVSGLAAGHEGRVVDRT